MSERPIKRDAAPLPTEANRWRAFWLRLALFLAPFAVGFLILTGGLIYTGEAMPIRVVLAHQQDDAPSLYRTRYGNRDLQYKQAALELHRPQIIVIGSSRMLQFRAGMFTEQPDAFYNAAGPGWGIEEVHWLLTHLDPAALPEIIILGIDPPWFNPAYESRPIPRPVSDFEHVFAVNRAFIQDILSGSSFDTLYEDFDVARYLQRQVGGTSDVLGLGLRAIRDGQGFRSDGSELFGDYLVARWLYPPQQRDRHLNLMLAGEDVYPMGDTIAEPPLQTLRAVLELAQQRGVTLIGVLPPYMPSLWSAMEANGQHGAVIRLPDVLRPRFAEYDAPLLDYSSGAWFGADDALFFDGWHPSELATLLMLRDMLAQLPMLAPYADPGALSAIADSAGSPWTIFGP